MSDDVIVRFGADASELEASLAKVSGQMGVLGSAASQANGQAASSADNATDAAKKQVDSQAQLVELTKQQAIAQEKLESLKGSLGLIDSETKLKDSIDAVYSAMEAESAKLKDLGAAGDQTNAALQRLKTTKLELAKDSGAKEMAEDYEKNLRPMGTAFASTINGMLFHQKSLKQAAAAAASSMLQSYISMEAGKLAHALATKLGIITADKVATTEAEAEATKRAAAEQGSQTTQTTAVEAGNAARSASGTAAAATDASTQDTGILKHAGSAAAAVYDDVSQIPYVGWLLAPPAAAAAFAAVAAFSAEGGWERVPFDGALTELHKDEMVLPAGVANTVRAASSAVGAYGLPSQSAGWANPAQPQVASTAAASSGSGAMTMHYSPNISAIDTKGARDFLDQHGRYMVDVLSRQQRNFAQVKK